MTTNITEIKTSARPGLRERKKQRTRAALRSTALRMFAERGFAATTVEEIADAVEVSPRTFFRYYPAKEDLLFADLTEVRHQLTKHLGGMQQGRDLVAELRRVLRILAEEQSHTDHEQELCDQVIAATPELHTRAIEELMMWEEAFAEAIGRYLRVDPARDLRPGVIAGEVMAALRVARQRWLEDGKTENLGSYLDQAIHILERGLQIPAGETVAASAAHRQADSLVHHLTALRIYISGMECHPSTITTDQLDQLHNAAEDALNQCRQLESTLRPPQSIKDYT